MAKPKVNNHSVSGNRNEGFVIVARLIARKHLEKLKKQYQPLNNKDTDEDLSGTG